MPSGSNKGQIIVAVLGFAGVLFTTLSSNWDKWFPRPAPTPIVTPTQLVSATPPATTAPPETATPLDTITLPANSTPRVIPTPRVTPFLLHTPNPRVTITQSDITTPPDTTPLPARPSSRVTTTPPDTTTPPVSPTSRVTPITPSSPTPRVTAIPSGTPIPPETTTRITSPRPGAKVGQKIGVEGVLAELRPDQHVFLCLKSQAFGRLIYPQGQVIPDGTGQWTVVSIYGTPGYSYETFLVSTSNPESATMLNAQQSRKYGMRDLPPGTERLGTAIVVTRE